MTVPPTVPVLLERNRRLHGDRHAVVTGDGAVTHAELDERSRVVAARLLADGVTPGERVALLAENGIDWVVAAVGVMRIGAVLVPLSTLLRGPELTAQIEVADVELVVATRLFKGRALLREAVDAAKAVASVRKVIALDDLVQDGAVDPDPVASAEAAVDLDDELVVLFTSGSRGTPKGVIHSHGSAVRSIVAGLTARCIVEEDRLYLPMPLFWTGGFSSGLFTMLVAGCTMLTEAEPEPARTLELLERERATQFRGWPDQAARLAAHPDRDRYDLSALRDASLPALLPAERRPEPGARPILFGMTESFGPYCADRLDRDLPVEKRGSCGHPFPGVEVQVTDPDSGRPVSAGEEGEIWLRGPSILRGICGRPASAVFTPEGFLRTGDLARIDEDGYLWFAGRLDDMFKVSGATVYPSEVELSLIHI